MVTLEESKWKSSCGSSSCCMHPIENIKEILGRFDTRKEAIDWLFKFRKDIYPITDTRFFSSFSHFEVIDEL